MQSRTAAIAALAGLLTTSAAPPPQIARPRPMPPESSPVRCVQPERDDTVSYSTSITVTSSAQLAPPPLPSAPPPPAPPPPPPPPAQPLPSGGQTKSAPAAPNFGVRATSGALVRMPAPPQENRERYDGKAVASVQDVAANPVSTFSVDVDTGAYANVRRMLNAGQAVPERAVRTEELINYFRYDYPRPTSSAQPFSVTTDVARTPWNPQSRLLRIGLRGYDLAGDTRPALNLVFLVDVSGSMNSQDKLPLVKTALSILADQLRPQDRVSIIVYAAASGVVLDPTSSKEYVKAALGCLSAGGSTAGGAGIRLAYDMARANFRKGAINRILLATDGDFNVGITNTKDLEELVRRNRNDGITLTTLGFGTGNYNEALMERIADLGNGNYAYIDSAMEAQKVLDDEMAATLVTIAKDVKVQVEFNPAQVKEYRLIGYENRALKEEDFANDAVDAGDIGAGHQVTALYEIMPAGSAGWKPERRYDGNRPAPAKGGGELAFVKLRYKLPGNERSLLIERPVPAAAMRTAQLPRGDMAFVTAVAAYGQRLRGDTYLGSYSFADARALAGPQRGYAREEFLKLTRLAESSNGGPESGRR